MPYNVFLAPYVSFCHMWRYICLFGAILAPFWRHFGAKLYLFAGCVIGQIILTSCGDKSVKINHILVQINIESNDSERVLYKLLI